MAYKNPEDAKAYRESHREQARECSRIWRLEHPGEGAKKTAECRANNADRYAESQKKYRAENRDKVNESQRKWRAKTNYSKSPKRMLQSRKDWLKKYGLTIEQYDSMLARQDGSCAICKSTEPRMKNAGRLYVDHCHETGEVRGLLCFRCNTMLGNAGDSPEVLRLAAEYLENGL